MLRWGYENAEYIGEVVRNYSRANIPLETQWADIDYMVQQRLMATKYSKRFSDHNI